MAEEERDGKTEMQKDKKERRKNRSGEDRRGKKKRVVS